MTVKLDETGLHAEDCGCMKCECGYRPSWLERQRARDQLARTKATMEALQKKPTKEELRRAERRRLTEEEARKRREEEARWRAEHPPLSQEQIQQLEEAKRREFPALAGGPRR